MLSGDISLNPGLFHNLQPLDHDVLNWRHIARLTNAGVIRISELKLDDSMPTLEIQINEYDLLHCDRNRHGGGVACYIRNDLSYNAKS